jgi:hypothetical protein
MVDMRLPYNPNRLLTQSEYVLAKEWWDNLPQRDKEKIGINNEFVLQNALQDRKTYLVSKGKCKHPLACPKSELCLYKATCLETSWIECKYKGGK